MGGACRHLARGAHEAGGHPQRSFGLDHGVHHLGLVGLQVVGEHVAELLVVALEVIGHHGQRRGGIFGHDHSLATR